jgi:hypothetical protein
MMRGAGVNMNRTSATASTELAYCAQPGARSPMDELSERWDKLNQQAATVHRMLRNAAACIDDQNAREVLQLQMQADAAERRLRDVELEILRMTKAGPDNMSRASHDC